MTDALVIYEAPDAVRKDIASIQAQVEDVLPRTLDPDRFLRVVAKTIIESPRLMACTRVSILAAVHEAAQLGLEPSGLLGSAYLVPYNETRTFTDAKGRLVKAKVMTCHLIPGYRGLIDLARRSGEIEAIQADIVRTRDFFVYEPTRQPDPIVHRPHIPNPTDPIEDRDRGPIVGAYMLATLRGGFRQPEWMPYDEIEAVRVRSRAADNGPWVTDHAEMCRKTVVRRGSKYLPLTTQFTRALELDEEAERAADPLPDPRPRSRASQMLLDRVAGARTAPDGPHDPDVGNDPSDEAGGPQGAATEMCGTMGSTGTCAQAKGHAGEHASGDDRW